MFLSSSVKAISRAIKQFKFQVRHPLSLSINSPSCIAWYRNSGHYERLDLDKTCA